MDKEYSEEETKVVDLDELENEKIDEDFYDKDINEKDIDEEEQNDEVDDNEEQEENNQETEKDLEREEIKKEEPKKTSFKNNNNKKLYIIIGVMTILIILGIILLIIFIPKESNKKEIKDKEVEDKTDKKSESQFVKTITTSLENGSLVKEINKGLKDSNINTNKVYLLNIDIDKDGKEELIVYAEDQNKKYILKFEINDEIVYEDNYQLDSKDSFGYAYSVQQDRNYFYTKYSENYTIIEKQKKVIKETDFMNDYFIIVNTYKNTPILNNGIEYDLETPFDVEKLENNSINEKTLLKDNDITENQIRPKAEEYFKNKKAEEEALKNAEEEKKKAEEEALKKEKESSFKLEGKTLHYGKYSNKDNESINTIVINSNGSGEIDGKSCTWKFGKHKFTIDEEEKELESVNFTCTEGDYYFTSDENDKLGDGESINLTLEKE